MFLNADLSARRGEGEKISVPCGVFVFLNAEKFAFSSATKIRISVPCGVFVFLNPGCHLDHSPRHMISVPCGVFVFLNPSADFLSRILDDFRPLRGLRVSQYFVHRQRWRKVCNFRPLRGLRVSQYIISRKERRFIYYFRPLRGLRVSQFETPFLTVLLDRISVPCGVFVFLNGNKPNRKENGNDFRPLRGLRVSQCQ